MEAQKLAAIVILGIGLFLVGTADSKTIGVKTDVEQKESKYVPVNLDFPEYPLADNMENSDEDSAIQIDESVKLLQEAFAPSASTAAPRRVKRTIGFLSRLGSCMLTFTSNPSCWSRLTRAQIQREERRQLEMSQQEEFRRNMDKEIYKGYINTLQGTNGTEGENGTGFQAAVISASRPRNETPSTTTTPRPIFPLFHKIGRGMSRLFPRLFGFLNPNGNNQHSNYDDSSVGAYYSSYGTRSRNDFGSQ